MIYFKNSIYSIGSKSGGLSGSAPRVINVRQAHKAVADKSFYG